MKNYSKTIICSLVLASTLATFQQSFGMDLFPEEITYFEADDHGPRGRDPSDHNDPGRLGYKPGRGQEMDHGEEQKKRGAPSRTPSIERNNDQHAPSSSHRKRRKIQPRGLSEEEYTLIFQAMAQRVNALYQELSKIFFKKNSWLSSLKTTFSGPQVAKDIPLPLALATLTQLEAFCDEEYLSECGPKELGKLDRLMNTAEEIVIEALK